MQPFFIDEYIKLTTDMHSADFLLITSGQYVNFNENLKYSCHVTL